MVGELLSLTRALLLSFPLSLFASYDNHLGRIVTGRVDYGSVKVGDRIKVLSVDGEGQDESKVTKLFYLAGMERVEVSSILVHH